MERRLYIIFILLSGLALGTLLWILAGPLAATQAGTSAKPAMADVSVSLTPGWNLVSFNVIVANPAITQVLSSIEGNYSLVYAWNAQTQQWHKYDPAAPPYANDLTELNHRQGFWIRMTTSSTLNVVGDLPTTTDIPLYAGWNLVGYPSSVSRNLPGVLQDHGGGQDFSLVYAYHADDVADLWKLWDRSAPSWSNDLTALSPGWGYWIRASANHTWTVEYSFLPDLVVDSIQVGPASLVRSQATLITVTVRNQGDTAAGIFQTDWYANSASPPSVGSSGSVSWTVAGLASGASIPLTTTYVFSRAGSYNLWAQADTMNAVLEGDEANNVAGPVTATFSQIAPCAISLDNGALYTARRQVQLVSDIDRAVDMMVSNDGGFIGVTWQPYQRFLDWTLSDVGERVVTLFVYARVRDAAGNLLCKGPSLSDDIVYDSMAPTVALTMTTDPSAALASAGLQAVNVMATLYISASDQVGGSGMADMQVATHSDFTGASWQLFSTRAQISIQPGQAVYVRVRDAAGNVSATVTGVVVTWRQYNIYLPVVARNCVTAPDLVVEWATTFSTGAQAAPIWSNDPTALSPGWGH